MSKRHLFVTVFALLLLTACNKQKDNPAEAAAHLNTAKELYAQKDFPRALVEVRTAIGNSPKSGDAHYLAGQINEAMGDGKSAFEEYARAASTEANNLPAQLKVVEILIGANQLDTALGRINGTLGSRPNEPDALALRALIEQRQKKDDKARSDAQASLTKNPGQPVANAVLAGDALAQKNPDRALNFIAQGLKAHPGDVSLMQLKAGAFLAQDRKDQAVAIYADLAKAEPKSPMIRNALAELKASTGDLDAGELTLREGIAAQPDSKEMRIALIAFLARHRDAAAVDKELRTAIEAQPKDSTFDLMLAEQALRAHDADKAASVLSVAIDRVPDGQARAAARIALARLSLERGDEGAARKLLDDAIAAKPDNDDALVLRAGLLAQADDTTHAVTDLLAVAARKPTSPVPLSMLAELYLKQGDLDKTVEALKKVVYFQPAELKPATGLAGVYLKQNKPDLAKQVLADFVKRNPASLDGRLAEMRLAVSQKDWATAQTKLDQMRVVPKSDRVVTLIGAELAEARGQPAAAAIAYKKMIDSTNAETLDREALAGYARASAAAGQTDDAIAFVSGLASNAVDDNAAYADLLLSALFRSAGQADKASAALQAAIKAAPKQPTAYLQIASEAMQNKQPDLAIATLDRGLAAGAPPESLLMAKAAVEDQTGKKDAAIASYQQALKANPRSLVAANNYASLVADQKPQDKALLADARKPIQRYALSGNPALLDTIAWLDYRLGNFQSAKDLLVRAKADTSDNAQLRFHYGAVLIAMGDKDAGRSMVKGVMGKPFPGHAEAEKLMIE